MTSVYLGPKTAGSWSSSTPTKPMWGDCEEAENPTVSKTTSIISHYGSNDKFDDSGSEDSGNESEHYPKEDDQIDLSRWKISDTTLVQRPKPKVEQQSKEKVMKCVHCDSAKDVSMQEVYYGSFKPICSKCSGTSENRNKHIFSDQVETFAARCESCKDKKNLVFARMVDSCFRVYCYDCVTRLNPKIKDSQKEKPKGEKTLPYKFKKPFYK